MKDTREAEKKVPVQKECQSFVWLFAETAVQVGNSEARKKFENFI